MTGSDVDAEINALIGAFKADLARNNNNQMVQRHIIHGGCIKMEDTAFYDLKRTISEKYHIHQTSVLVVGSTKLGFSISPIKRYRPFNDSSDIDLAIVSEELFDIYWQAAYEYSLDSTRTWESKKEFTKYMFKGWIRPDHLPTRDRFPLRAEWFDYFNTLSRSGEFGNYKIAAGIYRSWYFFEKYQEQAIQSCREEI